VVRREGRARTLPARELVPGDIVLLEAGDIASADLRLLEASKLEVDESALTGESFPVRKQVDPVAADAPAAERSCMLFKGTGLTRGSAVGVVVGTGMRTELGRITALMAEAEPGASPLERQLEALGRRLAAITLALAASITGAGILSGRDVFQMIETGIALGVAAVPEGLPVVATLALARGMWRMARRNALVERLSAVETLGSTSVILTDKTGTLTESTSTAAPWRSTRADSGAGRLASTRERIRCCWPRCGPPCSATMPPWRARSSTRWATRPRPLCWKPRRPPASIGPTCWPARPSFAKRPSTRRSS
jgi:Ca2+-transporting ATPase